MKKFLLSIFLMSAGNLYSFHYDPDETHFDDPTKPIHINFNEEQKWFDKKLNSHKKDSKAQEPSGITIKDTTTIEKETMAEAILQKINNTPNPSLESLLQAEQLLNGLNIKTNEPNQRILEINATIHQKIIRKAAEVAQNLSTTVLDRRTHSLEEYKEVKTQLELLQTVANASKDQLTPLNNKIDMGKRLDKNSMETFQNDITKIKQYITEIQSAIINKDLELSSEKTQPIWTKKSIFTIISRGQFGAWIKHATGWQEPTEFTNDLYNTMDDSISSLEKKINDINSAQNNSTTSTYDRKIHDKIDSIPNLLSSSIETFNNLLTTTIRTDEKKAVFEAYKETLKQYKSIMKEEKYKFLGQTYPTPRPTEIQTLNINYKNNVSNPINMIIKEINRKIADNDYGPLMLSNPNQL